MCDRLALHGGPYHFLRPDPSWPPDPASARPAASSASHSHPRAPSVASPPISSCRRTWPSSCRRCLPTCCACGTGPHTSHRRRMRRPCSARMPIICSSVNLVRFIVRPQVGADFNRWWRKNPVAGQFKPNGQIRADTRLAVQHPRERDAGHGKPFGSVGHRQPQRSNYIFPENLARMRRIVHHLTCSFGSAPDNRRDQAKCRCADTVSTMAGPRTVALSALAPDPRSPRSGRVNFLDTRHGADAAYRFERFTTTADSHKRAYLAATHAIMFFLFCQSAPKIDPLSASKNDPSLHDGSWPDAV
ncbi:hypothetical protein SDC9_31463 [bioreactor metagenome]|uniref:Uncharacterized protein n=1 Tax=bioreactor metagenome TaxID=1076179 RepID=A0A644V2P2_9ZZZZ